MSLISQVLFYLHLSQYFVLVNMLPVENEGIALHQRKKKQIFQTFYVTLTASMSRRERERETENWLKRSHLEC